MLSCQGRVALKRVWCVTCWWNPFAVIARMPAGCDGGAVGCKAPEGWLCMGRVRWASTSVVKTLLNLPFWWREVVNASFHEHKGYAKKKSSTRGPFIWIRSHRPSPPLPCKKGNKSHVKFLKILLKYLLLSPFRQRSLYHHHFCGIHHHNTTHQCVSQPVKVFPSFVVLLDVCMWNPCKKMCAFQFFLPAKLNPTSILHSGQ